MSDIQVQNDSFDPMKADVNTFIIETYNELLLIKDLLKEVKIEKNEALNADDNILEIMNQLDESKEKMLPLKEKFKVAKEEFKAQNMKIFEKELSWKQKATKLKDKLVKAYTYKESQNDKSPILLWNGKKELVINLTPKITKQKIDA